MFEIPNNQSYGQADYDIEELESLSFGYFSLGVLLPGFWGYLFLRYATDPVHYNKNPESCELLIDWALVAGAVLLIHAMFYMAMCAFACLGSSMVSWYPKIIRYAQFEGNYWRSFVLTFSLLAVFGVFGVINNEYERQFVVCGDLFRITQMFYYIFFSILASLAIVACLVQCSIESNELDEEDEEAIGRLNERRERRRRERLDRSTRRRQQQNPPSDIRNASYGSVGYVDDEAQEQEQQQPEMVVVMIDGEKHGIENEVDQSNHNLIEQRQQP